MKKLVLTSVCALAVASGAMAQGLINWVTAPGGNILNQTNSTAYSPFFGGGAALNGAQGSTAGSSAAGTAYYYTLLYDGQNTTGIAVANPTNGSVSSFLNSWTTIGLYATNVGTGGRIGYISPQASATLPWGGNSDANGQSNNIVLVGWSQNLGTTWGSVSNFLANWGTLQFAGAFFGVSSTGFFVGNDSPSAGAAWTAATVGTQTGNGLLISQPTGNAIQLYLLPTVPEPSTLALAGLGGLGLMLFRRRK